MLKSKHSLTRAITLGATAVTLALPLAQAYAQDVVEEVIVTARQRQESITDVPASITAFSEADIESAGIQRAEDFIALTPGVSMVDSAEVGDTQVSIRGINGSRDAEANFAFIVDGILHTNPSAFNREFSDLKQIEVLKGPQGALYGRSASAGAVIVTTQDPTNETSGSFKVSGASQNSQYVAGGLGGALVKDELFGRINFDYRHTDGFYKNTFLRENNVDDFENYNVSGKLIWEPRDDLRIDFRGHYGEVDAAAISFNANFSFAGIPQGSIPRGIPLNADVNDHQFAFQNNRDPSNEQESLDFSIKFDWDMDWATLTGWFLYSDIDQEFLADGTSGAFGFFATEPSCIATTTQAFNDGVVLPAPQFLGPGPAFPASFFGPYTPTTCDGYQYQVRNQDDRSFEFRLTSKADKRLRWQVGMYYLDLDREVGVAQLVDDGRQKLPKSLVNPLTEALVHDEFQTEVWAVFGNVQYDIADNLEASIALRYDREDREANSLVPPPATQTSNFIDYTNAFSGCDDGAVGSPLNPAFVNFNTCTISQSIADRDEVWDEIQPKISLRWDFDDEWTFFASWGRGFKSGGFNNLGSASTVNLFFNNPGVGAGLSISDSFEKETSDAFEVGFKAQLLSGRLNVEGAVFHTMVDDMQFFNFFVGPFGLLRVVSNIDESSITGAEFAGSVAVTDNWDIYGGFSLIKGVIDENSNRPQTEGNDIPYAPEYTINFGTQYIFPALLHGADGMFRVDYSIVGPTWFATVQEGDFTPGLFSGLLGPMDHALSRRDTYGLVNVRAGLEKNGWGLHAFVRNLTNKNYLEEVIPAPEFGGSFIHPGAQRQWGMELSYSF